MFKAVVAAVVGPTELKRLAGGRQELKSWKGRGFGALLRELLTAVMNESILKRNQRWL